MTEAIDPQYFFIIGAMKAGTTSLYKYLAGHPELYASPRKEPRVFRGDAEPTSLRETFLQLFASRTDQRWCFEGSTAYTKYPLVRDVPRRLHTVVPDARFVYLVRNPVERTWSHYLHNLAHGHETRPLADALNNRPQYLDISRYHLQLSQYTAVFPRDRVLVQVFEDMVADPVATVRAVCQFLKVESSYTPASKDVAYNASHSKRAAPAALRALQAVGVDEVVPWRVRNWLRMQGDPLPKKEAELTPDLRSLIADAIRPDTEAFFDAIGYRIPSWTDFT
jgi:hypothetical protein